MGAYSPVMSGDRTTTRRSCRRPTLRVSVSSADPLPPLLSPVPATVLEAFARTWREDATYATASDAELRAYTERVLRLGALVYLDGR